MPQIHHALSLLLEQGRPVTPAGALHCQDQDTIDDDRRQFQLEFNFRDGKQHCGLEDITAGIQLAQRCENIGVAESWFHDGLSFFMGGRFGANCFAPQAAGRREG